MSAGRGPASAPAVSAPAGWGVGRGCGLQQRQRVDVRLVSDPLQALEGQVAFATLHAAQVGAVDAEQVGEGFLAETASVAVASEVLADGALEVAFHGPKITVRYLTVYRLMSSVGRPVSRRGGQRPVRSARAERMGLGDD